MHDQPMVRVFPKGSGLFDWLFAERIEKNQRVQAFLIGCLGNGWMRWRPRGRSVDSRLNFLTFDLTHFSSPNGRPRSAATPRSSSQTLTLPMPEATHQVIVYHADGLHVGVHDSATDEFEAAMFKVFAESVGLFCCDGQFLN